MTVRWTFFSAAVTSIGILEFRRKTNFSTALGGRLFLDRSMSRNSLSTLIASYCRRADLGPRLDKYLDYFRTLKSLDDAIQLACHGKDGKIHGHQYRVGKQKLEQAR